MSQSKRFPARSINPTNLMRVPEPSPPRQVAPALATLARATGPRGNIGWSRSFVSAAIKSEGHRRRSTRGEHRPSTLSASMRCRCSQPVPGRHVVSEDRRHRLRPRPLNEAVRRQMQSMPRVDTGVEVALRRELHRLGLRYRVHVRALPGTPDIALTKARVAVFVDGCFWHRCPQHGTSPKNNSAWWAAKLDGNVVRDRRKDMQLQDLGWTPIHVWEHEDPAVAAGEIYRIWRERVRPSAGQMGEASDS